MLNNKQNIFKKIFTYIKQRRENKQPKEYSKKILTFIIFNAICMLYMSYGLAWHDKIQIAEDLSKTVATTIISVIIPYLIKSALENTNKYGSRINKTTKDFDNLVYEDDTQSTI